MGIEKENYGVTKEGKRVTKYTLTNGQGASVSFLDYGAVIQSIIVPDKDGKLEDVVLGYDTLSGYESNVPSFGSPVGRCANRISNACFVLNGKEYPLDNNDATNCLHGGFLRYNYLMYDAECAISQDDASVSFSRVSPDGEQGFPGNLTLTITYTWNDANELMIEYNAVSDADTILNITNHSYFNIGDISQIEVQNLPSRCYDSLQGKYTEVPATRRIEQGVDCIYTLEKDKIFLVDKAFNRRIQITHHHADSIVLWNPWEKTPSAMKADGYKNMVCIETARLEKLLQFGESISAEISALPADI